MITSSNNFLDTDFKEKSIQEINKILGEELKKPAKKRNYDKIEELTGAYAKFMGTEAEVRNAMQRCLLELKSKARPKRKFTRRMRGIVITVSLAMMLFITNIITVSAFNMNVFSFIVHVADSSFSVDFFSKKVLQEDVIQFPTTNDDPYGIIAECAKNCIYPETPHYLPEEYVLTLCKCTDMPQFLHGMKFTFKNQNNADEYVCFTYDLYEDVKQMAYTKYPNIEHNLTEIEINGKPAILAEEKNDNQTRIVYHIDNLLVSIFIQGMSNDKINNIVNSIY